MANNPENKINEHPVIVFIIFILLLVPILILFGNRPFT